MPVISRHIQLWCGSICFSSIYSIILGIIFTIIGVVEEKKLLPICFVWSFIAILGGILCAKPVNVIDHRVLKDDIEEQELNDIEEKIIEIK